jgi:hypothetical protein
MHPCKCFRILIEAWGEGGGSPESRFIAVIGKAKLTAEARRTAGIRRRQNLNADDTDLNWGFKNSTPGLNCASPYFSGLIKGRGRGEIG